MTAASARNPASMLRAMEAITASSASTRCRPRCRQGRLRRTPRSGPGRGQRLRGGPLLGVSRALTYASASRQTGALGLFRVLSPRRPAASTLVATTPRSATPLRGGLARCASRGRPRGSCRRRGVALLPGFRGGGQRLRGGPLLGASRALTYASTSRLTGAWGPFRVLCPRDSRAHFRFWAQTEKNL